MRVTKRDLCAMVLGGVLVGCTMLVQEEMQTVHVSSTPPGASVMVDGSAQVEPTPLTVTLDPRRTHEVSLAKACYTSTPVMLRPGMGLRTFGTYGIPVSQLPPTVHVDLTPTCAAGRSS